MPLRALIFDVDGTLAETEEVHRAAFNATFQDFSLPWHWDIALYGQLLKITGGKERLRHYAQGIGAHLDEALIAQLHARKNTLYGALIARGGAPLRSGVMDLISRAQQQGLRLAIATTTSRVNVDVLLRANLGADADRCFDVIVAGDEVARKKPAPDAYLKALADLGLPAAACMAFEDSANGLAAGLAAGLRVVVTPGIYTQHEDFSKAALVLPDL
ncbi:MAG: HAD-IA family hydrolase, partial [Hyphomicrobiales bacterium]|nr:HAD-IA family hydrolase [Hyphomicrobiales bacterium]